MAKARPTQRTLDALRRRGYTCGITEHWNPHTKTRHDLFGFIDLIAIGKGRIIAVQATSGTHTAERLAKIRAEPRAITWLESGGEILIIGWRQLVAKKKDGSKAKRKRWASKCKRVRLSDLLESRPG